MHRPPRIDGKSRRGLVVEIIRENGVQALRHKGLYTPIIRFQLFNFDTNFFLDISDTGAIIEVS